MRYPLAILSIWLLSSVVPGAEAQTFSRARAVWHLTRNPVTIQIERTMFWCGLVTPFSTVESLAGNAAAAKGYI